MSFTGAAFLVFVAVSVFFYYVLPKCFRWPVLLVSSYCFYMAGGVYTVGYLLFTTVTTYFSGMLVGKLNTKHYRKLVVLLVVFLNFGLLFALKYWGGLPGGFIVPLGISFYMFQSVGYVIDVYRKKYQPERNIGKFALFVSFFPQIIQGPISRFDQLAPQLTAERHLDWDMIKKGIQLAMWGYFKKLVIAGRAGLVVDTVFSNYGAYDGALTAFSVLFYCFQLYCDFSGGIDISRGVASMFGIDLIENFRRPMFAVSLADYWRRWHISLGAWMKDYVFYPISLSRAFRKLGRFSRKNIGGTIGKILPTSIATFIVYFIIGIWHGANFRYVFYGFWNGAIITSSLILAGVYAALRKRFKIGDDSGLLRIFRMVRTWFLVFVGRYITRAPRLLVSFVMLKNTLFNFKFTSLVDGSIFNLGLAEFGVAVVFLGMAVIVAAETVAERGVDISQMLDRRGFVVQWFSILVPLAVILMLGVVSQDYVAGQFIYAQF